MKPIKCFTYVLCLVAVLVTTSAAQVNAGNDKARQERRIELQRTLRAFAAWTKRYTSKPGAVPSNSAIEEGITLARQRHAALSRLIDSDPALVLSQSIGGKERIALPPQIQKELETPVSGNGDFLVACAMPTQGTRVGGGILRFVRLNGVMYRAAVYGRRANMTTKLNVPLHGIAVDDVLALDQDVLAEVTAEEASSSGEPIVDLTSGAGPQVPSGAPVFARMARTVYRFASAEHLRQSEALLEEAESGPASKAVEPASSLLEHAGFRDGVLRPAPRPLIAPVPRPTNYKVLVLRVDFSDLPGDPHPLDGTAPYTMEKVQALADQQVAPFYQNSSYGKAQLSFTITPKLYRLAQTAASYAARWSSYDDLRSDALAAVGPDYNLGDYEAVIVLFSYLGFLPNSQITFGGLTLMGTPAVWVNGEFDFRVVAHELGHTFDLAHASFWETGDGDPVSTNGSSLEYQDPFDIMGYNWGYGGRADFNPWYKYELNWIDDSQVQTVTQNGVYRVYRFDNAQATGTLALKVPKDATRDYWIGYRRNFAENAGLENGAYVVWGTHSLGDRSNLLGLGAQVNKPYDPGLMLDTVLADAQANISVIPVAEGGIAPHEYLDVLVIFAPPLVVTQQPESQMVLEGQNAQFTVEASGNPGFAWQRQASGTHDWITLNDGGDYAGTATPTLQIAAATLSMSGDAFRCLLTNSEGGFNTSKSVVLTVNAFGVQTIAGQAGVSGLANGFGELAQFSGPTGIAVDRAGNIYIADTANRIIRKISPSGHVSTLAGLAGVAGNADGTGDTARFNIPVGITVDSAGIVYVVDQYDSSVRRITPYGVVTTLTVQFVADASGNTTTAPAEGFNHPSGIAVDCFGNLYIADTGNNTIRKVTPDGVVSILAGETGMAGATDGPGASARFNNPFGIAVDVDGNVYVSDQGNSIIRKITPNGSVLTIAGLAGNVGSADGPGAAARFSSPAGLAVDSAGNLYVADRNNSTIRKIDSAGNVSTLAGVAGTDGSADGPDATAQFSFPTGLAVDLNGVVYVADTSSNTIRMIRSAPPAGPTLRLAIVADQVRVIWPATATGFELESRSDLSPGASWTAVTASPEVQGCNFVVTIPMQTPAAFFRLRPR